jgi:hypothetical protein
VGSRAQLDALKKSKSPCSFRVLNKGHLHCDVFTIAFELFRLITINNECQNFILNECTSAFIWQNIHHNHRQCNSKRQLSTSLCKVTWL